MLWQLTDQMCEVAWELFEGPLGTQSSGLGSSENGSKGILWGWVSETLGGGWGAQSGEEWEDSDE